MTCYLLSCSTLPAKVYTEFRWRGSGASCLEVSYVDAFGYDATQNARHLLSPRSNSGQQCCRTEAFSSLFCMRVYFCIARCRLKQHYFCFVHDANFLIREISCICITRDYNRHQRAPNMPHGQKLYTKASTTLPPLSPCGIFFIFLALF